MLLRRSRYHMLPLAEELATAANKQLTPMESLTTTPTCQNEYLCKALSGRHFMWCVYYLWV